MSQTSLPTVRISIILHACVWGTVLSVLIGMFA